MVHIVCHSRMFQAGLRLAIQYARKETAKPIHHYEWMPDKVVGPRYKHSGTTECKRTQYLIM
jgi:hypothetical protein